MIVVALCVIVLVDNAITFKTEDSLKGVILGLFGASLGLTLIACIISSVYRRALLRIIPLCNK